MYVGNGEVQLGNHTYNGQVYVSTKRHDSHRLISLTAIKDKYTDFKSKPVIFILDGRIVKGDYDKYIVDESYLLQINVDRVNNPTENIDVEDIERLTKSGANIKELK